MKLTSQREAVLALLLTGGPFALARRTHAGERTVHAGAARYLAELGFVRIERQRGQRDHDFSAYITDKGRNWWAALP